MLDVVSVKGVQTELASGQLAPQVWSSGGRPRLEVEIQESLARRWQAWSPSGWTDPDCVGVEREEGQVQIPGGHGY